jgi:hypothetical protein
MYKKSMIILVYHCHKLSDLVNGRFGSFLYVFELKYQIVIRFLVNTHKRNSLFK